MLGRSGNDGAEKAGTRVKRLGRRGAAFLTENPLVLRLGLYLARFLTAWLLAGAVIFEGSAPFAAGFIAVSGGGLEGFFALAGALVGAVMKGGFDWAVRYNAIAVLVYAAAVVFKRAELRRKSWFMPLITAGMAACTGFVFVLDAGFETGELIFTAMEVVLAGASAYFYALAFSAPAELGPEQAKRRRIALCAAVCTVLIALSDLQILGLISLGRAAAVLCVLAAGYKGGAAAGAAAGMALGLSMDMAAGVGPLFCAAMGGAGAISGLFAGNPRLAAATIYVLVNAVMVVWGKGERLALSSLYETFLASVAFLMLPESLYTRVRDLFTERLPARGGDEKLLRFLQRKAELGAEAFAAVSELLGGESGSTGEENIQTVFDAVAERKCLLCPRKEECYGRLFEQSRTSQNDAALKLMLRGSAEAEDFSGPFLRDCRDAEGYLRLVNEEYAAFLRRRERRRRAGESYELLCGRFEDLARVMEELAGQLAVPGKAERELQEKLELYLRGKGLDLDCAVYRDGNNRFHIELDGDGAGRLKQLPDWLERLSTACSRPLCELEGEAGRRHLTLLEAEPLAVRIGVASLRREGEEVSGDKGAYFKTDSGLLHVILADGMGSGEAAAQDSGRVIALLEKFLRAGVPAENCLRLVGAALQLKGEESLGSATVDLLSVDLFSGRAELFKYGAAPSFIKNGGSVAILEGESLPAGLRGRGENLPDKLSARLRPGDTAVIVSDGVAEAKDCDWLAEALAAEERPGREFAQRVLRQAEKRHGCGDDMTVITVHLEKR